MKKIYLLGFILLSLSSFGQKSVNNYSHIIVDEKLAFLKKVDQYQTSSLAKFLFNKYGFIAYLNTDELPEEIMRNRCTALFASINNESSMLTTKLQLVLKDCNGRLIFTSQIGKSKEKEFKKAYHEAIRNAFLDSVIQNYKYAPKKSVTYKSTVKEIVPIPVKKKEPIKVDIKPVVKKTQPEIIQKNIKKTKWISRTVLYAQIKESGYQLVDMTPKVVFDILRTNQTNVFIIKNKNGILYKEHNSWVAEFYEGNRLIKKVYQIKF